ncbi:MAG: F0F1 ATP synthase subunit epsilon [Peptococcaceae bacterium]|nr:F0F1 ATP synthase subunit epsilon [Peptococcaceae bacterium]
MSEKLQELVVVTPEREVLREQVRFVLARGGLGELGVLPGHAPLITTLETAPLEARRENKRIMLAIAGGFMEVSPQGVVVLADAAERAEEIDVPRARRAKERAEKRLASKDLDIDIRRAEAALKRALVRLQVAAGGEMGGQE